MTKNDRSLLKQMIEAGRFNFDIYELLVEQNASNAKESIKKMGEKWCCHPANKVKRLEMPLPILSDMRASKILKTRK